METPEQPLVIPMTALERTNELLSSASRASRVTIDVPQDGRLWVTTVKFDGPRDVEIEFEKSDRFLPPYDILMGFDCVEIKDLNSEGCQLEYGRYILFVVVDGDESTIAFDSFKVCDEQQ